MNVRLVTEIVRTRRRLTLIAMGSEEEVNIRVVTTSNQTNIALSGPQFGIPARGLHRGEAPTSGGDLGGGGQG